MFMATETASAIDCSCAVSAEGAVTAGEPSDAVVNNVILRSGVDVRLIDALEDLIGKVPGGHLDNQIAMTCRSPASYAA